MTFVPLDVGKNRKASVEMVCGMLAKLLGTSPAETLEGTCANYLETAETPLMLPITNSITGLYAWECDLPMEMMHPKLGPLPEALMTCPGQMLLVRSTSHSGVDSLWVAVADPYPEIMDWVRTHPCLCLLHTRTVPDAAPSMVLAVQLKSCQP